MLVHSLGVDLKIGTLIVNCQQRIDMCAERSRNSHRHIGIIVIGIGIVNSGVMNRM